MTSHGGVISVVDDDESIRQAVTGLLRSAGFLTTAFASAEELLGSPHLATTRCLILDLRMPGMDGLELQQRLATAGHRFPIIVLTAHGDGAVRTKALEAGARAFLPKPLDGERLLDAVEAAVGPVVAPSAGTGTTSSRAARPPGR